MLGVPVFSSEAITETVSCSAGLFEVFLPPAGYKSLMARIGNPIES